MPIEPDDLISAPLASPPMGSPHAGPLRSQLELVRTTSNARWGAVIGGVFVTASTWLVLHLFGMGVGMTAISPDDSSGLRGVGIGIGIWSILAPILALFAGGLVASRLAPSPDRYSRMLHGVLVWAVTTLIAAFAISSLVGSLARGAASVGQSVGAAAGDLGERSIKSLGIDAHDLAAPINERLRAEGKPTVTPTQLERAIDDAITTSVSQGTLKRETLVSALDKNTALTAGDIEEITGEVEARWQRASQRAEALASRAKHASLAAADATGKALLGLSLAMMLGVAAAVGGALITGRRDRRRTL